MAADVLSLELVRSLRESQRLVDDTKARTGRKPTPEEWRKARAARPIAPHCVTGVEQILGDALQVYLAAIRKCEALVAPGSEAHEAMQLAAAGAAAVSEAVVETVKKGGRTS